MAGAVSADRSPSPEFVHLSSADALHHHHHRAGTPLAPLATPKATTPTVPDPAANPWLPAQPRLQPGPHDSPRLPMHAHHSPVAVEQQRTSVDVRGNLGSYDPRAAHSNTAPVRASWAPPHQAAAAMFNLYMMHSPMPFFQPPPPPAPLPPDARLATSPPPGFPREDLLHQQLKVMFWNVNNDARIRRRPDMYPSLTWERRREAVLQTILHSEADIVAITEITVLPLLQDLLPALSERYDICYSQRYAGNEEFAHALFYRRSKLFLLRQETWWTSYSRPDFPGTELDRDTVRGRCVLVASFAPVHTNRGRNQRAVVQTERPLHCVVSHFGIHEETKNAQAIWLRDRVNHRLKAEDPLLLMGDYNSFSDGNWMQQRAILSETGASDLKQHTVRQSNPGELARDTFRPYIVEGAHECARIMALPERFLDGIFVRPGVSLTSQPILQNPTCMVLDAVRSEDGVPPSDHFPLLCSILYAVDPAAP